MTDPPAPRPLDDEEEESSAALPVEECECEKVPSLHTMQQQQDPSINSKNRSRRSYSLRPRQEQTAPASLPPRLTRSQRRAAKLQESPTSVLGTDHESFSAAATCFMSLPSDSSDDEDDEDFMPRSGDTLLDRLERTIQEKEEERNQKEQSRLERHVPPGIWELLEQLPSSQKQVFLKRIQPRNKDGRKEVRRRIARVTRQLRAAIVRNSSAIEADDRTDKKVLPNRPAKKRRGTAKVGASEIRKLESQLRSINDLWGQIAALPKGSQRSCLEIKVEQLIVEHNRFRSTCLQTNR